MEKLAEKTEKIGNRKKNYKKILFAAKRETKKFVQHQNCLFRHVLSIFIKFLSPYLVKKCFYKFFITLSRF